METKPSYPLICMVPKGLVPRGSALERRLALAGFDRLLHVDIIPNPAARLKQARKDEV